MSFAAGERSQESAIAERTAMAELSQKVKIALDETRMLILGAQVLVGFQFRAAFQDAFETLPAESRALAGVALILMLIATACLIAPGARHQLVERGRDSGHLLHFITRMGNSALLPFALSLGLDLYIAVERIGGRSAGLAAGLGFSVLALLSWYGIELLARRFLGGKERQMSRHEDDERVETKLHQRIDQVLTEARVILPGAQALLGFQLAIVVTAAFDKLPQSSKLLHAASLGLIAIMVIMLMAPAAFHRIVYAGEDTESFCRTASRLVTGASVPFAVGLGCEVHVVIAKIAEAGWVGLVAGVAVTAGCAGLWHLYPWLLRRRAAA